MQNHKVYKHTIPIKYQSLAALQYFYAGTLKYHHKSIEASSTCFLQIIIVPFY